MLSLLLVGILQKCRRWRVAPRYAGTFAVCPSGSVMVDRGGAIPPSGSAIVLQPLVERKPMNVIHYGPASALPLEAVAELYTQTFADYFYAAHVTADLMRMFQRVEQIDLAYSPVQYIDDEPVGLATVGLRGEQACCKGFGVIVPYRGRGLAEPLCEEVIRQARRAGAATLQLGVLKQNERAVRTYLHSGFHISRDLLSFEWRQGISEASTSTRESEEVRSSLIVSSVAKDMLQHFDQLHPAQPSWAHDLPALRAMEGLSALASLDGNRLNGYILYERDEQGDAQVKDVAADSPAVGAALLRSVCSQFPRVYRNNETADSPMVAAFAQAGFRETLQRYEMKLVVSR